MTLTRTLLSSMSLSFVLACSSTVPLGNGEAEAGGTSAAASGAAGSAGTTGSSGVTGSTETTGAAGSTGTAGSAGAAGSTGAAGSSGSAGTAGSSGSAGSSGIMASGGSAAIPEPIRSTIPRDSQPALTDAEFQTFIASTNDFAFDLMGALPGADKNLFFSPLSAEYALAMTYAGAQTRTAEEMKAVFHNTLSDTAFHAGFNRLSIALTARNIAPHLVPNVGEKSLKLNLVESLWADQTLPIVPEFLDTLSKNYDSGLRLVDFIHAPENARLSINRWVSDETSGKIAELLPTGSIDNTARMVLSNALYFYGSWAQPFSRSQTKAGEFVTGKGVAISIPMMHAVQSIPYAAGPDYQMVDLAYDGGQLSMSIVLPAAGKLETLRSSLSRAWVTQARSQLAPTDVNLSIPKFHFQWGTVNLNAPLIALGMKTAFSTSADFNGISPNQGLQINDVFHQAFGAIDEDGTEAAAATAVVIGKNSVTPSTSFSVDRPFLVLIRDDTGAILFCGQVMDPSAP